MYNYVSKIIFVLITLLSFQVCNSQIRSEQFNKNLKSISKKSILPGFSVTILKNDSIYFQNGYGFAEKKIGRIIMINAALDGEKNDKAVKDFMKIISEIESFETTLNVN